MKTCFIRLWLNCEIWYVIKTILFPRNKKQNIIKRVKEDYKQEKILIKDDIKPENLIERRTKGFRIYYSKINSGKKY